jgi:polyribonucleotide nucleotidyltransferase
MVIECPQAIVGRVIGSSGATIKEVQSRTGAKIQIDQNFPEGIHSDM